MNREDCAIVVNSCPKYFYLLNAHFGLLRRYAAPCKWPVYLATEVPEDPIVKSVAKAHGVQVLELDDANADFLESRLAACRALPLSVKYILPLQEDFLLERPGIDIKALEEALEIFDTRPNVASIRLMPCPGPLERGELVGKRWAELGAEDMKFSYQATLWRREIYSEYMASLIQQGREMNPELKPRTAEWNRYAIRTNPAETQLGMYLLEGTAPGAVHLCWVRKAVWANAVYWSPWPYRPTAIVQGKLEDWARELVRREGFGSLSV